MSSGLRTRYNLQEGSRACISTCTVGPLQVNLRRVREDHSFCADYSTTPKTTPSVGPVSQLPTSRLVVQWPKTSSDWVPAFSSCSPQSTRSCPPIIPHPCCSCFAHSSPFASCSRYPLCPFHPMPSHPIPSHPIPSHLLPGTTSSTPSSLFSSRLMASTLASAPSPQRGRCVREPHCLWGRLVATAAHAGGQGTAWPTLGPTLAHVPPSLACPCACLPPISPHQYGGSLSS